MLVFGTRPEAIKMCPLVKEFQKYPNDFETIVCVTGQHREMLDQVLTIFDVKPNYDLNIMKQGQDLYDVTARVLTGMRNVLKECKPDVVLVHGDTTTSTAAALAAFYQQIPVGHVEAGLRTNNIYSPWPEEMNRQITGRIATYNFSPTPLSESNLKEEKAQGRIFVTGNTVIDALHMVVSKLKSDKALADEQINVLRTAGYDVNRLNGGNKLVLITGHRRENFGDGFISMVTAMKDLSEMYPDVDFVYPMHLNPNVRKPIHEVFGDDLTRPNFFFIEPLQYLEFVYLMEKSTVVLTDSGGIQEEAPGLGKPVLVMRDTTERPEALKSGTVHLVGTNHDLIVSEVSTLLDEKAQGQIFVTGNTVIDALRMVVDKLNSNPALAAEQDKVLLDAGYDVSRLEPETCNVKPETRNSRKLVLITGHRRENFGEGFISMVTAMKDLSEKYPEVDFVYPMHLNPNVRKPIHEVFGEDLTKYSNFFFIEPLQYLEFVYLMEKSTVVLTDSGGIQEEAPGLGKPVLVMRDTTERPEALKSGTVHLVGTNHDLIVSEVSTLLDDAQAYERMSKAVNPYGDGKACSRIVRALKGEPVDRYEVK